MREVVWFFQQFPIGNYTGVLVRYLETMERQVSLLGCPSLAARHGVFRASERSEASSERSEPLCERSEPIFKGIDRLARARFAVTVRAATRRLATLTARVRSLGVALVK